MTRVMVVDDHPMWRSAVVADLTAAGFEVVAEAGGGHEALRRARATRPDVVVLDLQIPELGGVEVTRRLVDGDSDRSDAGKSDTGKSEAGDDKSSDDSTTERRPPRVLILSASGEPDDVLEAVKAGATGYLVKSASREEFLDAVRRTAEGDAVFTPGLAGLVLGEFRRLSETPKVEEDPTPELTDRETEVLRLVAKGMSYKEIAERLVLSHRTVQNHVQNTLRKLQLHNRVELVRYAIEQGLDEE